jgi:hypothetical protein
MQTPGNAGAEVPWLLNALYRTLVQSRQNSTTPGGRAIGATDMSGTDNTMTCPDLPEQDTSGYNLQQSTGTLNICPPDVKQSLVTLNKTVTCVSISGIPAVDRRGNATGTSKSLTWGLCLWATRQEVRKDMPHPTRLGW